MQWTPSKQPRGNEDEEDGNEEEDEGCEYTLDDGTKCLAVGVMHHKSKPRPWIVARQIHDNMRSPHGNHGYSTLLEAAIAHDVFMLEGAGVGLSAQEARDRGLNYDLGVHADPRVAAMLQVRSILISMSVSYTTLPLALSSVDPTRLA